MSVRLHLFGSPTVDCDGESFALPPERRSQLLAFLALKRSWVGRAELAAMLWPEQAAKLAYTNLRKTLHRLQSLPWARGIEVQGGALRFEAETDVCAFESALREGRIADALPLRRGELLQGFDADQGEAWASWLAFERDRLTAAWRGAVLAHLGPPREGGEPVSTAEAIALSAQLLEADPLDEAALRAHMSWLARDGRGAQARQAYRDFTKRLADDLGLAPGAELQAHHDSLGVPAAALPAAPDDGFVGRAVELRQIASLLAQGDCRLLCLVGPGGVGKTRLARRTLETLGPGYPDGAAFVELEGAASPADIANRIAREAGAPLTGRANPLDQVIESLRGRRMLLVLDNFEHLAADASVLERLLKGCAQLTIVVTSRVRLGIPMEQLLPLEGLPCPEIEDQDRFEGFDAVRLFVKAARRVEPALVPEAEATAIADICRQVGGLPLALELAASWTRVLSCEAIAAELREGSELLHASIEVVFDRSWRLLGAVERDALSRLSVFRGGFSVEAARAVTGASLPVLGALADKSLLRKEGGRLHFHPLVQHLAALRLGDTENRDATRDAHALYFHRLMTRNQRGVEDGDREALRLMDVEFENWRAAWRWSVPRGTPDAVARCVRTLISFCDHRVRFEEGIAVLREAIDAQDTRERPGLEALFLAATAHLEYRLDRYAEAQATAARALEATRAGEDHEARLQCLKVLAGCCLRLGKPAEARRFYEQALKLAPANSDPHNAAAMLDNLALVEKLMGRYAQSLRLSLDSLVRHRGLKDAAGEALCLNNLGDLYLIQGDYEPARAHLQEGLAICDRHGIVSTRALILANLMEISLKTGDLDAADSYAGRALDVARATGTRALESWIRIQTAHLALRRGDLAGARSDLAASLEVAIAMGRPSHLFAGVSCFAEILAAQGETECARQILAFSASHPSIGAQERDQIRARQALEPAARLAWPGLTLDELARRIVVERNVAHAPLIATLRGAR